MWWFIKGLQSKTAQAGEPGESLPGNEQSLKLRGKPGNHLSKTSLLIAIVIVAIVVLTSVATTFDQDLIVKGQLGFNAGGESATVYLGDTNHYIRSTFGVGMSIGTFQVPELIKIRQTTGILDFNSPSDSYSFNVNARNGIGVASLGKKIGLIGSTTEGSAIHAVLENCTGPCTIFAGYAITTGGSGPRMLVRIDGKGKGFFSGGTQTGGADFAESMQTFDESLEPADVLVIDPENPTAVKKSATPYSQLVAGIYSTRPGILATEQDIDADLSGEVPVAIVGIVPVKVTDENGPISIGDMLVTSSLPGHAMKAQKLEAGTILGKALQSFESGSGVIKVLVILR